MSWNTVGPYLVKRARGDRTGKYAVICNEGDAAALDVEVSVRVDREDGTAMLVGDVPADLAAGESFELKISDRFVSGVLTLRWRSAKGKAGVWHGPIVR